MEPIEAICGSHPDCPFTVFEKCLHLVTGQAILLAEQACPILVRVHKAVSPSADPKSTVAIAKNARCGQGRRCAIKRIIRDVISDDLTNVIEGNQDA